MRVGICCGRSRRKKAPTISAPLHLILKAPVPAIHDWKRSSTQNSSTPRSKRLCQLCHLYVEGCYLKCKNCRLCVHPQCAQLSLASRGDLSPSSKVRGNPGQGLFKSSRITQGSSDSKYTNYAQINPFCKDGFITCKGFAGLATTDENSLCSDSVQLLQSSKFRNSDRFDGGDNYACILDDGVICREEETTSDIPHSSIGDNNSTIRFSSCGDSFTTSTAIHLLPETATETPRSESKTPELRETPVPGREVSVGGRRSESGRGGQGDTSAGDSGCPQEDDKATTTVETPSSSIEEGNRELVKGWRRKEKSGIVSPGKSDKTEGKVHHRSPARSVQSEPTGTGKGSRKSGKDTRVNKVIRPDRFVTEIPKEIEHVGGPLDGSPYALVNTTVKGKGWNEQNRFQQLEPKKYERTARNPRHQESVQMKDLDRLIEELVQHAESIPDIPYHARENSMPFSYTRQQQPYGSRRHHSSSLVEERSKRFGGTEPLSYQSTSKSTSGDLDHGNFSGGRRGQKNYVPQTEPRTTVETRIPIQTSRSSTTPFTNVDGAYHKSSPVFHQYRVESQISDPRHAKGMESRAHDLVRSSSSHTDFYGRGNNDWDKFNVPESSRTFGQSKYNTSGPSVKPERREYANDSTGSISLRRNRSLSADGRAEQDGDVTQRDWYLKLKKRLEDQKAAESQSRQHPDLLAELKRHIVQEKDKEQPSAVKMTSVDRKPEFQETTTIFNRTSSPSSATVTSIPIRVMGRDETDDAARLTYDTTPNPSYYSSSSYYTTIRSNVSTPGIYSSDDETDRELDFLASRGRSRLSRKYSESGYDQSVKGTRGFQRSSSLNSARGRNVMNMGSIGTDVPRFPACPPTPYLNRPVSPKPPRSPKLNRKQYGGGAYRSEYFDRARSTSLERSQTPFDPQPVIMTESGVKIVSDFSNNWFKPSASREETINSLKYQSKGTFLIRSSNSFPGAFGLAIKVDESTQSDESVRHFLIEQTAMGVRIRGSSKEPVYASLPALVFAHSVEPLSLPTRLLIPEQDNVLPQSLSQSTTTKLLEPGPACQLLFIGVAEVEQLTGDNAVTRAIQCINNRDPVEISLRLSKQGLTLTDLNRKRFFRMHFPLRGISHAAVDPENQKVVYNGQRRKVFGVVAQARDSRQNSCIILAELEEGQPAGAIVAFFQRVIECQNL